VLFVILDKKAEEEEE
jgi:hypothetical protein